MSTCPCVQSRGCLTKPVVVMYPFTGTIEGGPRQNHKPSWNLSLVLCVDVSRQSRGCHRMASTNPTRAAFLQVSRGVESAGISMQSWAKARILSTNLQKYFLQMCSARNGFLPWTNIFMLRAFFLPSWTSVNHWKLNVDVLCLGPTAFTY